jgi:hypothetical protein
MFDLIVADLIVLIHLGFIAFVVLGGLLALRWRWMPMAHLPAVFWGALVEFEDLTCPLTPLENHFRLAAGGSAYSGDFIARYLVPLIYPASLSRDLQFALGVSVCLLNAIVYLAVWRRRIKH